MRHKVERCGIHTRLKVVIRKSGGYDRLLVSKLLMDEYNIKDSSIAYEMADNARIREEIDAVGIDAIVKLTMRSLRLRRTILSKLSQYYQT